MLQILMKMSLFQKKIQSTLTYFYQQLIKTKVKCDIKVKDSNDPRSYRQDSTKLINTGFKPKKNISKAIDEMIVSYEEGNLIDKDEWHTVRWMKSQEIK